MRYMKRLANGSDLKTTRALHSNFFKERFKQKKNSWRKTK